MGMADRRIDLLMTDVGRSGGTNRGQISLISLIVIVRPRIGGLASSLLAADVLRSMLGFGMTLLALHLAIRPWGTVTAFGIALLVSASWSAALLSLRRRMQPC